MTYATSNPPALMFAAFGGVGPSVWQYKSTDASTAVDAAGYIANAGSLGMKVGDLVFVTDSDASPIIVTTHVVTAITSGAADLSDLGATVGSTNTD